MKANEASVNEASANEKKTHGLRPPLPPPALRPPLSPSALALAGLGGTSSSSRAKWEGSGRGPEPT